MQRRQTVWRQRLMGSAEAVTRKRELFSMYVKGRCDVPEDTLRIIQRDLPRTFPKISWVADNVIEIEMLLTAYAAVHKGDSYLQGFNYHMTILYHVFHGTEHALADTWWCFSRVIGLIRPLIPDFNTNWFQWCRRQWTEDLFRRLRQTRPQLHSILEPEEENFSTLVTCKWFMLWFAQTVPWEDIFELWDIFIQLPPQDLLRIYMLLTHEILKEVAPTLTYRCSHEPCSILHVLLSVHVKGIQKMATRVIH